MVPYWTLVRFGQWEEMLKEPAPPAANAYLTGAWHYARGQAFAATGRLAQAKTELAALEKTLKDPAMAQPLFSPNTAGAILSGGAPSLAGEIAAAEKRFDDAVAHLEHAVRLEEALVYTEPSEWAFPPRHALGAVLLAAGRASEAETVFWQDLKRHRENGWALTGLVQALRAQDQTGLAACSGAPRVSLLRCAASRNFALLSGFCPTMIEPDAHSVMCLTEGFVRHTRARKRLSEGDAPDKSWHCDKCHWRSEPLREAIVLTSI